MDYTGSRFGHYSLEERVGQGGFADVYLALDRYLKRYVAMKVLREPLFYPDQRRFLREARLLARLDHPHIVKIIEFNFHHTIPYCVMEYAPNGSLKDQHPLGEILSLAMIIHYARQIAAALTYLHAQGFVHRDIKPHNLLLNAEYRVLLADFGIAALIPQTDARDDRPQFIGTFKYMAPECFAGSVCPASDQYALAVVIYEWLTGKMLFDGSRDEIIDQHCYEPVPTEAMKEMGVPYKVRQVLLKALAKEPEERFVDVQAFVDALEAAHQSIFTRLTTSLAHWLLALLNS